MMTRRGEEELCCAVIATRRLIEIIIKRTAAYWMIPFFIVKINQSSRCWRYSEQDPLPIGHYMRGEEVKKGRNFDS